LRSEPGVTLCILVHALRCNTPRMMIAPACLRIGWVIGPNHFTEDNTTSSLQSPSSSGVKPSTAPAGNSSLSQLQTPSPARSQISIHLSSAHRDARDDRPKSSHVPPEFTAFLLCDRPLQLTSSFLDSRCAHSIIFIILSHLSHLHPSFALKTLVTPVCATLLHVWMLVCASFRTFVCITAVFGFVMTTTS